MTTQQPPAPRPGAAQPYPPPPPVRPAPVPPPASYPPPPPPGPTAPPPPAGSYPPAAYPWNAPAAGQPKPSAYWALSIAAVLLALLPGAVAIYYSSQVGTTYAVGDLVGAQRASRLARAWGIAGVVIGVIVVIAVIASASGGSSV